MTNRTFAWSCICCLPLFWATGCATSKNQQFASRFLPAAPALTPAELTPALDVDPVLFAHESPTRLAALQPKMPTPTALDVKMQKADAKFQAGKLLYQQGDREGARQAFDAAIDLLLTAAEGTSDRQRVEKRLDDLVETIYRYDIEGLGSGEIAQVPSFDKAPLEDILELTFPVDPKLKLRVKEQLTATSSQLPLQLNDTVLSYINYFSSDRGHRTLLAGLRRAGRYKLLIARILEEEQVPQELIYLAQAESGFLPRAISRAAAVGMWQFVQDTGRLYGLKQTPFSDDRMDPEKATRAAAKHLKDLYTQLGDWPLALAAYNCGPGCVDRAVQRTGYADYWELRARNAIPRETTNYVPIIMAMTIMAKNAKAYGLEGIDLDSPMEYETLPLTANTHLALVADLVEQPSAVIADMNPALRGTLAPAGYELRVPKGTLTALAQGLERIPGVYRAAWRMHRVSGDDSVLAVAKRYRTSAAAILEANGRATDQVSAGEFLVVPGSDVAAARATVKSIMAKSSKSSLRRGSTGKILIAARTKSTRAMRAAVAPRRATAPATGKAYARRANLRTYATATLRRTR